MRTKAHDLLRFLAVTQISLQIFFSGPGGDIGISREQFRNGSKSDFFGTFANTFYALIPDSILKWYQLLTLLQCFLVMTALFRIYSLVKWTRRRIIIASITQSILIVFAAQQSRDGTLFAFLLSGISLIYISYNYYSNTKYRRVTLLIGIILVLIGFAFRPWMTFCVIPLISILWFQYRRKLNTTKNITLMIFIIMFLSSPVLIELASSKIFSAKPEYPFQLVIIHDLSAAACWSANVNTSANALQTLKVVSTSSDFATSLCQYFKPNTWQAVAVEYNKTQLTEGLQVPLALTRSSGEFRILMSGWINLITKDPKTYFQNKLMFLPQVLFATQGKIGFVLPFKSQSTKLKVIESSLLLAIKIFHIPWLICSIFYLLTPGFFLLLFLFFRSFFTGDKRYNIPINGFLLVLFSLIISTLLFVSDNARYTTPFVVLGYFLTLTGKLNLGKVNAN